MLYATLQEAFPGAYTKKNTTNTNKENNSNREPPITDINNANPYKTDEDCYYSNEGIKMGSCNNKSNTNDKVIITNATGSEYVTKNCTPLQLPVYKLPIKKDDDKKYSKVIENAINNNNLRDDNITKNKYSIKPYDFDEYDAYLNINDIETNNIDNTPEYRTTPLLKDYLMNLRDKFKEKKGAIQLENIEQFTNYNKKITVDINIYNLLLFMFIGIIILILCDQVIKLAIIIANNKNI